MLGDSTPRSKPRALIEGDRRREAHQLGFLARRLALDKKDSSVEQETEEKKMEGKRDNFLVFFSPTR
jgi:hypothetical protein